MRRSKTRPGSCGSPWARRPFASPCPSTHFTSSRKPRTALDYAARAAMALETGARLGPYEILSVLGTGGMGEVYKARDTRLDRTVAIKVIRKDHAEGEGTRMRFEHEARLVAQISHPCVLTL